MQKHNSTWKSEDEDRGKDRCLLRPKPDLLPSEQQTTHASTSLACVGFQISRHTLHKLMNKKHPIHRILDAHLSRNARCHQAVVIKARFSGADQLIRPQLDRAVSCGRSCRSKIEVYHAIDECNQIVSAPRRHDQQSFQWRRESRGVPSADWPYIFAMFIHILICLFVP